MEIGIIGFGQMAQFISKFLKQKAEIFVSDIEDKLELAKELGVKFVPMSEAAEKEIVILAVPINQVRQCMMRVKDNLREGCLLLDICSVKVNPVREMLKLAPEGIEVVGTHPLFGPQTGKRGIEGLRIVVCPVRTTRLEEIREFLESFGLEIIVCSPEEHDKAIAETQALEHFIGRALINLDAREGKITTPTFKNLLTLKETFKDDSMELFNSMQEDNPFAKEVRKEFLNELNKIERKLK